MVNHTLKEYMFPTMCLRRCIYFVQVKIFVSNDMNKQHRVYTTFWSQCVDLKWYKSNTYLLPIWQAKRILFWELGCASENKGYFSGVLLICYGCLGSLLCSLCATYSHTDFSGVLIDKLSDLNCYLKLIEMTPVSSLKFN